MIALYGEEFDVFPESFGGWEFFFNITLHSSDSISQGTVKEQDFFFPKAKFKKTEARPRKCSALGHSSTRLCCQHCQT